MTLLAILIGVSVGVLRDTGRARSLPDATGAIADAAVRADQIAAKHPRRLWALSVGESWTPPTEAAADPAEIRFTRMPCASCPESWGRLEVAIEDLSFTRFRKFRAEPEGSR